MNPFELRLPRSTEEAAGLIAAGGLPIAGGTDLVPLLKYEVKPAHYLINIAQLPELQGVREQGGRMFIGAAVTLTDIERDPRIRALFSALCQAAGRTASPQIRNLGTLGGNLFQDRRCIYFNQSYEWRSTVGPCYKTGGSTCHQAPVSKVCRAGYYGDTATALCVLDATAQVVDAAGRREVPIADLCETHGRRNGTTEPDRLLIEGIWLPIQSCRSRFVKVSVRQSIDFPTFNCAVAVNRTSGAVRLAVGAVRESPLLLEQTSRYLSAVLAGETGTELLPVALEEIRRGTVPVVEAAITVQAKRDSFCRIEELLVWATE